MNRQQKEKTIKALEPMFEAPHFYVTDCEGLTAAQMYRLRSMMHAAGVPCKHVPNALLQMLFAGKAYEELGRACKQSSTLLFAQEQPTVPAQIIAKFQKNEKTKKPVLKGAWACEELFVGSEHLGALAKLKSKEVLIGELVALLCHPAQELVEILQSGGTKIAGLVETLSNK